MLTLPPDPYLALQVERDAGLPEIRTAYRKLILKCHPDKIQDPLQKQLKQDEFQKVQSAYELLSSDVEKSRYDNMYKLNQLEKERAKMETSAPRSSRRERESDYHGIRVHVAEPRASTYSNSPFPSPSKAYAAGTPPSRSYEEVYTTYEPPHPPRKTASYESARGYKSDWEKRDDKYERKSKKDDKKDRDEKARKEEKEKRKEAERKEREREREKEDRREEKRREKEKSERKEKDKEERRREKEKDKKKAEQARKKDADLKAAQAKTYASQKFTTAAAYSSSSEDDGPKITRRSSGTQEQPPASERERKYSETIEVAADYLARSGAKVSINTARAKPLGTEQFSRHHAPAIPMAAPTPPVAGGGPFMPPPPQADIYEEEEPHRSSAKSSSRRADKSYKKPSARGSSRDPASVEYTHRPPPLQHSATMPIRPRQSETPYISRPVPNLSRAQTFQESSPRYSRERSRSRNRRYHSDDEDSDGGRHARRSHGHRSPERGGTKVRYAVENGKTSARQISSEDISRHHKSSKSGYPTANTGVRMDPEYSHYPTATPGKVRYAPTFAEEQVKYADYTSVTEKPPIYTY